MTENRKCSACDCDSFYVRQDGNKNRIYLICSSCGCKRRVTTPEYSVPVYEIRPHLKEQEKIIISNNDESEKAVDDFHSAIKDEPLSSEESCKIETEITKNTLIENVVNSMTEKEKTNMLIELLTLETNQLLKKINNKKLNNPEDIPILDFLIDCMVNKIYQ